MKSLNDIVQKYIPAFTVLGDEENKNQLNINLEEIRNELVPFVIAKTRQIRIIIWVVIILVLIFVPLTISIIAKSELLTTVASICTIVGVTPLTLLSNISKWIKERENAKMLLKMVDSLNKETFQSVLIVIATMLKK